MILWKRCSNQMPAIYNRAKFDQPIIFDLYSDDNPKYGTDIDWIYQCYKTRTLMVADIKERGEGTPHGAKATVRVLP